MSAGKSIVLFSHFFLIGLTMKPTAKVPPGIGSRLDECDKRATNVDAVYGLQTNESEQQTTRGCAPASYGRPDYRGVRDKLGIPTGFTAKQEFPYPKIKSARCGGNIIPNSSLYISLFPYPLVSRSLVLLAQPQRKWLAQHALFWSASEANFI
jgi:hypothetical protein